MLENTDQKNSEYGHFSRSLNFFFYLSIFALDILSTAIIRFMVKC